MSKATLGFAVVLALIAGAWLWPASRNAMLARFENTMGVIQAHGVIVGKSPARAAAWFAQAAERGSAAGAFNLAFALQEGTGVPRDRASAARWYARAANGGVAEAANNLASMYANPVSGEPNLILARAWLKRGLASAGAELRDTLNENLAAIENQMTPEEVAASDRAGDRPPSPAPESTDAPDAKPPETVAADTQTDPATKVTLGLEAARPMRAAVDQFLRTRGHLPAPAEVVATPALQPRQTPHADLAVRRGGLVLIRLRGGALNGHAIELVPALGAGGARWACVRDEVPAKFFRVACP